MSDNDIFWQSMYSNAVLGVAFLVWEFAKIFLQRCAKSDCRIDTKFLKLKLPTYHSKKNLELSELSESVV